MKPLQEEMGRLPELKWIPINDLYVDPEYQRNTSSEGSVKNINHIRENFSWAHCGALTVCRVGKQFAILDGQHRWKAANSRDDIKELPCLVVDGLDIKKQAAGFVAINTKRVKVHSFSAFHAAVVSGETEPVALKQILDKCNIEIPRWPTPQGKTLPNQTQAIGSLLKMLEVYSEKQMIWALSIVPEAYGNKKGQLRSMLIKALAEFVKRNPTSDRTIMIETLQEIDPAELEKDARSAARIQGGKSQDAYLHALERAYKNKYNASLRR